MKAYAIKSGATESKLRGLGHDIAAALQHSDALGLTIAPALTKDEIASVELLSYWYKQKLLEYPLIQGYRVPSSYVLRSILDRLLVATFVATWGSLQPRNHRGFHVHLEALYGRPPTGYIEREHQDPSSPGETALDIEP